MQVRIVVTGMVVGIATTFVHVRLAESQSARPLPTLDAFLQQHAGCVSEQRGAALTGTRAKLVGMTPRAKAPASAELTIAQNFSTVDPNGTPESCDNGTNGYVTAPRELLDWTPTDAPNFKVVLTGYSPPSRTPISNEWIPPLPGSAVGINIGANEGRLRADLRMPAGVGDPNLSLCQAAVAFAVGKTADGNAFADLSVTGRRAFAAFRAQRPDASRIMSCLQTHPYTQALPVAARQTAADAALDRAYRVLNLIRAGGWPVACPERAALRPQYIAVSGEDDQPHRPVNAPSAEFPQYDLNVTVPRPGGPPLVVHTRYMIAHTVVPQGAERTSCAATGRTIPADRTPVLAPDAEVFLFIHGMDSRLEEAMDLTHVLHTLGRQQGRNFTVIAMDLPTSGYADNIDNTTIAPLAADGMASGFEGLDWIHNGNPAPLVDFDENFIVSFVNTLNQSVPVASHIRAIIGGSLGGNMAMRLGRPRPDAPWVTNVVPWSPASIWPSLSDAGIKKAALAVPFHWAGGDPSYLPETPGARRSFFYGGFDWQSKIFGFGTPGAGRPQSEYWYRDNFACKGVHLRLARIDRYETYNRNFRLWHWRLALEQLQFSHQLLKPGTNQPLYLFNTKRMLLICGIDDTGGDLCASTQAVAPKMVNTPGAALFLTNTGHSIHSERPNFLARHIVDFIGPAPLSITGVPVVTVPMVTTTQPAAPSAPARIKAPPKDITVLERAPNAAVTALLRTLVVRVEQVEATDSLRTIVVVATDSQTQDRVDGTVTINGAPEGSTGAKITVPARAKLRGTVSAKGYNDAPFTP
ncbi:MAG: hypothetical protein M3068_02405 [Gemmatimonadota bacterium]|nr:hypothetical protein [Gemmatimonadota bacterium]